MLVALQCTVSPEIFQAATDGETSILEPAALVKDVVGRDVMMSRGPTHQGNTGKNYSGISMIERMLGWALVTTVYKGLYETCSWICASTGSEVKR